MVWDRGRVIATECVVLCLLGKRKRRAICLVVRRVSVLAWSYWGRVVVGCLLGRYRFEFPIWIKG